MRHVPMKLLPGGWHDGSWHLGYCSLAPPWSSRHRASGCYSTDRNQVACIFKERVLKLILRS